MVACEAVSEASSQQQPRAETQMDCLMGQDSEREATSMSNKTTGEDTLVGCSRPLGGMDCIIEAGDKPVKGGRCCSYEL